MRFSLATAVAAACAVSIGLAGCSNSAQGSTGSVPGFSPSHVGSESALASLVARTQLDKTHPSVLPIQMQMELQHRAKIKPPQVHPNVAQKDWITDDTGYIWGTNNGTIVTYLTDCSGAEGGIVDHTGRLIVACTSSSTVNIYNAGNTTGPANVVLHDESGFYPADAFEDTHGNIYATNIYGEVCQTTYDCNFYNGNVVWWTTSNQANGAGPSGSYTDPNFYYGDFGDVDKNGNVYIDTSFNSCCFAPEVDEITGITGTGPVATNLNITLHAAGGVYVVSPSKPTAYLVINDEGGYHVGNNALYSFALPFTGATGPWGPDATPQNKQKSCEPIALGFSKNEKDALVGDSGCHAADYSAALTTNVWSSYPNIDFVAPISGAFLASDK
jgi:hypothetical protein